MEEILKFIQPELLLIVPVLWVIGKLLKEASFIPDKFIPLLLGGVSILLAVCWIYGASDTFTVTGAFTAITQGVLCAGVSVYGHQVIKQLGKPERKSDTSDTEERDADHE